MSNERVHEALSPASFPGFEASTATGKAEYEGPTSATGSDVTQHLDQLAQDIVATPGAGGALLVAFAAQARALTLVIEAVARAQGASTLPADVLTAVQSALRVPPAVSGLELSWHR